MDSLRETMLADCESASAKPRFGLFSQPPPLSLGDDTPFRKVLHPRNELGKPLTAKPNLHCVPHQDTSRLFSFTPNQVNGKSPYIQPHHVDGLLDIKLFKAKPRNENRFKPADSVYKHIVSSVYEHIDRNEPPRDPRARRNSEGRVSVEPKNVTTAPHSRVVKQFFKDYQYVSQPFNRPKELRRQELLSHRAKLKEPFKQSTGKNECFNNIRSVFGQEGVMAKTARLSLTMKRASHDRQFKPSSPAKAYFEPFPQFMPEPVRVATRQGEKEKRDQFKRMYVPRSKPCPSITLNLRNLSHHL